MNNLVLVHNNQAVVSSRTVAEKFEKTHKHVLDAIRNIGKAEISAFAFYEEHQYKVKGQYRSYPEYYMNRDGFMLLVMGFTTKPAMQVKIAFIKAFNEMEAKLQQQNKCDTTVLKQYQKSILALTKENAELRDYLKSFKQVAAIGLVASEMLKSPDTASLTLAFARGMNGK